MVCESPVGRPLRAGVAGAAPARPGPSRRSPAERAPRAAGWPPHGHAQLECRQPYRRDAYSGTDRRRSPLTRLRDGMLGVADRCGQGVSRGSS
jgi:hypothetical protein